MPEDAALGLLHEARAQRRVTGAPAGEPLVGEALEILDRSGHADGPAASSALGLQGAWRLAAGNAEGATTSFGRAAEIDERRAAPATERVISLTNLAAALVQSGRTASALQILRRALAVAESAPDVPPSLADGVRSTINELQRSGSLT
jgi:tetratricopeptide (TPR) repeat protein